MRVLIEGHAAVLMRREVAVRDLGGQVLRGGEVDLQRISDVSHTIT
jgi:hypothetical protein